jgi:hypothetical protein
MDLERTLGNQALQRFLRANGDGLEMDSGASATTRFAHDFSGVRVHAVGEAAEGVPTDGNLLLTFCGQKRIGFR